MSKAFDTLDECLKKTKLGVLKHMDKVDSTSYITRKEKLDVKKILGCPKSRDVMRDKKFVNNLEV